MSGEVVGPPVIEELARLSQLQREKEKVLSIGERDDLARKTDAALERLSVEADAAPLGPTQNREVVLDRRLIIEVTDDLDADGQLVNRTTTYRVLDALGGLCPAQPALASMFLRIADLIVRGKGWQPGFFKAARNVLTTASEALEAATAPKDDAPPIDIIAAEPKAT